MSAAILGTSTRLPFPLSLSPSSWVDGSGNGVYQNTALTTPATTNGQTILGWKDQSGNGNHWTNTTANGPTLATTAINGLNAVLFSGAQTITALSNFTSGQTSGSVYLVIQNVPGTQGGIWKWNSLNTTASYYPYSADSKIYESWGCTTRYINGVVPSISLNQANIYNCNVSATACSAYLNTTLLNSTTGTVTFPFTPVLGYCSNNNYNNAYYCEMLVFNYVLSTAQNTNLVNYLAAKWGAP